MDWLAKKLNIRSLDDWVNVSQPQMYKGATLLSTYGGIHGVLQFCYPGAL